MVVSKILLVAVPLIATGSLRSEPSIVNVLPIPIDMAPPLKVMVAPARPGSNVIVPALQTSITACPQGSGSAVIGIEDGNSGRATRLCGLVRQGCQPDDQCADHEYPEQDASMECRCLHIYLPEKCQVNTFGYAPIVIAGTLYKQCGKSTSVFGSNRYIGMPGF